MKKTATAVHVYYDDTSDLNGWCIADVDDDGDEIRCDGADSLVEAWEAGCSRAADLGVPCVEIDRLGQEADRYEPGSND